MFCTQCGVELRAEDVYCSQCGHRLKAEAPRPASERLMRDMGNKKIAGVCAGLARYIGTDPVLVRVIFLVLAFATGIGFIAYIVGWIIMPKDTTSSLPAVSPDYSPAVTARNS
jgi:phage shock protein C